MSSHSIPKSSSPTRSPPPKCVFLSSFSPLHSPSSSVLTLSSVSHFCPHIHLQAVLAALPSLGLSPSPSSPLASITPFLLSLTTDELTSYSSSSTGDGEGEEQVMLRKDVADALRVFWEAEETKRAVEPGNRGRFQLNECVGSSLALSSLSLPFECRGGCGDG